MSALVRPQTSDLLIDTSTHLALSLALVYLVCPLNHTEIAVDKDLTVAPKQQDTLGPVYDSSRMPNPGIPVQARNYALISSHQL